MTVVNMMETLAKEHLDRHWDHLGMPCSCITCRNDVLALVLNALPPRYVSTERGQMFVKAAALDEQFRVDVLQALYRAARAVATRPSHPVAGQNG
ncbi:MAG: late competence development ComFB family protein [Bacillota bacterium]